MPKTRFPRTARVRAKSDFDRIFKHGRRVALPVLALHWQTADAARASCELARRERPGSSRPCFQRPESGPRLGLAVSRKVDPHAVGRNRIKRVLRETFRACRADLADGDYVLVARVGAARCDHQQLQAAFLGLLQRAGALPIDAMAARGSASAPLPRPGADGTMPPSRRSDVPSSTDPTPPSGGG
ncbi:MULTISPECIES: ribonuclease P protein component [unclassified Lysobacter]